MSISHPLSRRNSTNITTPTNVGSMKYAERLLTEDIPGFKRLQNQKDIDELRDVYYDVLLSEMEGKIVVGYQSAFENIPINLGKSNLASVFYKTLTGTISDEEYNQSLLDIFNSDLTKNEIFPSPYELNRSFTAKQSKINKLDGFIKSNDIRPSDLLFIDYLSNDDLFYILQSTIKDNTEDDIISLSNNDRIKDILDKYNTDPDLMLLIIDSFISSEPTFISSLNDEELNDLIIFIKSKIDNYFIQEEIKSTQSRQMDLIDPISEFPASIDPSIENASSAEEVLDLSIGPSIENADLVEEIDPSIENNGQAVFTENMNNVFLLENLLQYKDREKNEEEPYKDLQKRYSSFLYFFTQPDNSLKQSPNEILDIKSKLNYIDSFYKFLKENFNPDFTNPFVNSRAFIKIDDGLFYDTKSEFTVKVTKNIETNDEEIKYFSDSEIGNINCKVLHSGLIVFFDPEQRLYIDPISNYIFLEEETADFFVDPNTGKKTSYYITNQRTDVGFYFDPEIDKYFRLDIETNKNIYIDSTGDELSENKLRQQIIREIEKDLIVFQTRPLAIQANASENLFLQAYSSPSAATSAYLSPSAATSAYSSPSAATSAAATSAYSSPSAATSAAATSAYSSPSAATSSGLSMQGLQGLQGYTNTFTDNTKKRLREISKKGGQLNQKGGLLNEDLVFLLMLMLEFGGKDFTHDFSKLFTGADQAIVDKIKKMYTDMYARAKNILTIKISNSVYNFDVKMKLQELLNSVNNDLYDEKNFNDTIRDYLHPDALTENTYSIKFIDINLKNPARNKYFDTVELLQTLGQQGCLFQCVTTDKNKGITEDGITYYKTFVAIDIFGFPMSFKSRPEEMFSKLVNFADNSISTKEWTALFYDTTETNTNIQGCDIRLLKISQENSTAFQEFFDSHTYNYIVGDLDPKSSAVNYENLSNIAPKIQTGGDINQQKLDGPLVKDNLKHTFEAWFNMLKPNGPGITVDEVTHILTPGSQAYKLTLTLQIPGQANELLTVEPKIGERGNIADAVRNVLNNGSISTNPNVPNNPHADLYKLAKIYYDNIDLTYKDAALRTINPTSPETTYDLSINGLPPAYNKYLFALCIFAVKMAGDLMQVIYINLYSETPQDLNFAISGTDKNVQAMMRILGYFRKIFDPEKNQNDFFFSTNLGYNPGEKFVEVTETQTEAAIPIPGLIKGTDSSFTTNYPGINTKNPTSIIKQNACAVKELFYYIGSIPGPPAEMNMGGAVILYGGNPDENIKYITSVSNINYQIAIQKIASNLQLFDQEVYKADKVIKATVKITQLEKDIKLLQWKLGHEAAADLPQSQYLANLGEYLEYKKEQINQSLTDILTDILLNDFTILCIILDPEKIKGVVPSELYKICLKIYKNLINFRPYFYESLFSTTLKVGISAIRVNKYNTTTIENLRDFIKYKLSTAFEYLKQLSDEASKSKINSTLQDLKDKENPNIDVDVDFDIDKAFEDDLIRIEIQLSGGPDIDFQQNIFDQIKENFEQNGIPYYEQILQLILETDNLIATHLEETSDLVELENLKPEDLEEIEKKFVSEQTSAISALVLLAKELELYKNEQFINTPGAENLDILSDKEEEIKTMLLAITALGDEINKDKPEADRRPISAENQIEMLQYLLIIYDLRSCIVDLFIKELGYFYEDEIKTKLDFFGLLANNNLAIDSNLFLDLYKLNDENNGGEPSNLKKFLNILLNNINSIYSLKVFKSFVKSVTVNNDPIKSFEKYNNKNNTFTMQLKKMRANTSKILGKLNNQYQEALVIPLVFFTDFEIKRNEIIHKLDNYSEDSVLKLIRLKDLTAIKETKIDYELKTFKSVGSSIDDRLKAASFLGEKKNTYGTSNGGEFNTKKGKELELQQYKKDIPELRNGSLDYNTVIFLQKSSTIQEKSKIAFLDCFEYDSKPFKVKQELYSETIALANTLREGASSLKPRKSNDQALNIADDANALISLQSSLKSINPELKDPKIQKYFDAFNNGISEMLILCSSNDQGLLDNILDQLLLNGKSDLEKYLREAVDKKFNNEKNDDVPPPASVSFLDNLSKKVKNAAKVVTSTVKKAASEVGKSAAALGKSAAALVRGPPIGSSSYTSVERPVTFKNKTAINKAAAADRQLNRLLVTQNASIDKNLSLIITEVSKHLRFSPQESIQILSVLPKYIETQKKIIQDEILPEMESIVKTLYEITSETTKSESLSLLLSRLEDMREGGAKAKRNTYKKKNIHIKKQTHPINAKKIKRKTTIKHKKVNKKKYTKENR
jgi:hypothetical protein